MQTLLLLEGTGRRLGLVLAGSVALAWGGFSGAFAQAIPQGTTEATAVAPAASKNSDGHSVMLLAANTGEMTSTGDAASAGEPTYLKDVLPIFMGHCSRCHNSQARFVYDWLDYKTAFRDRYEIKRRIWDSWKGSYYKESMPIQNSPESLAISETDRMKIKNWVLSGAPRGVTPVSAGNKTKAERIVLGRQLFTSICAACHQAGGQGIPNMFPPLAGSDFLNSDKARAIQTVIYGRQGEVIVNGMKFNNNMPSFPLTDDDIANALTYVYNSFGNSGIEVSPEEVKALRGHPPEAPTTPAKPNPYE